jgi:hypothetical protein
VFVPPTLPIALYAVVSFEFVLFDRCTQAVGCASAVCVVLPACVSPARQGLYKLCVCRHNTQLPQLRQSRCGVACTTSAAAGPDWHALRESFVLPAAVVVFVLRPPSKGACGSASASAAAAAIVLLAVAPAKGEYETTCSCECCLGDLWGEGLAQTHCAWVSGRGG